MMYFILISTNELIYCQIAGIMIIGSETANKSFNFATKKLNKCSFKNAPRKYAFSPTF